MKSKQYGTLCFLQRVESANIDREMEPLTVRHSVRYVPEHRRLAFICLDKCFHISDEFCARWIDLDEAAFEAPVHAIETISAEWIVNLGNFETQLSQNRMVCQCGTRLPIGAR